MLKFQVPAFLSLGAIKTTISQGDSYKSQHYNATEATADAAMQYIIVRANGYVHSILGKTNKLSLITINVYFD